MCTARSARFDIPGARFEPLRKPLHGWDLTLKEASQIQRDLAPSVATDRPLGEIDVIAAADVSCDRAHPQMMHAGIVAVDLRTLQVRATASATLKTRFPYVPGYLSFRELPVILKAFDSLTQPVQAVLCDGQGIAHPRHLGLASHLGLWLGLSAIGCAKSSLCGSSPLPANRRGARSDISAKGGIVGAALRTRPNALPIYISVGHLCDLASAIDLALRCAPHRRCPLPLIWAHELANRARREWNERFAPTGARQELAAMSDLER